MICENRTLTTWQFNETLLWHVAFGVHQKATHWIINMSKAIGDGETQKVTYLYIYVCLCNQETKWAKFYGTLENNFNRVTIKQGKAAKTIHANDSTWDPPVSTTSNAATPCA